MFRCFLLFLHSSNIFISTVDPCNYVLTNYYYYYYDSKSVILIKRASLANEDGSRNIYMIIGCCTV
jgi:hypothetical protein